MCAALKYLRIATASISKLIMILTIFALLLLNITNAQELEDSEYDGAGNTSCISKYRDLEAYILNNKDLMDNLTDTFFKTGKPSTEFVKIDYKFKILMNAGNNASYNITNDTTAYFDDDELELTCINDQRLFIWSSSALYLLGPEPLFWMTLFAVHVPENTLTIQLPCLCNNTYNHLLSRFTYLVRNNIIYRIHASYIILKCFLDDFEQVRAVNEILGVAI